MLFRSRRKLEVQAKPSGWLSCGAPSFFSPVRTLGTGYRRTMTFGVPRAFAWPWEFDDLVICAKSLFSTFSHTGHPMVPIDRTQVTRFPKKENTGSPMVTDILTKHFSTVAAGPGLVVCHRLDRPT
jgi:hypothetical protein